MRKRTAFVGLALIFLVTVAAVWMFVKTTVPAAGPAPESPVDIGTRLEPFIDEALVASMTGAALRLHEPVFREAVITFDKPWEGNTSTYVTVFRDGDLFRMYYRGSDYDLKTEAFSDNVTCYAESRDGVRWTKPELGFVAWRGSKANNIVWAGPGAENFAPFKDTNPACPPEERYKALGGGDKGLRAFKSADGFRWSLLREAPVLTGSWFDSLNTSFWDETRGEYLEFNRNWINEVREIQMTTSGNYLDWAPFTWLDWEGAPREHLYTNAITPYPRAPHIYIGFPKRFLPDRRASDHKLGGVSDGLFMSSRDGIRWKKWREVFLRPGLQQERWVNRNNLIAWGVLVTRDDATGRPEELSIYSTEGYYVGPCRLRRHTLRLDGFVSVRAGAEGGEVVTKPLLFKGGELVLNVSTSAAGSVRVEVRDEDGRPIPGYALDEAVEFYGDGIEIPVRWRAGTDLGALAGKPVSLRFVMKDADLYAFRFR